MKVPNPAYDDPMEHALPYLVCGVSFHKSSLAVREQVSISEANQPEALRLLQAEPGIRECMLLSTCNRTELYLSVEEWVEGKQLFLEFMRKLRNIDLSRATEQIYVFRGTGAVVHLFRVASSLDSLVLGESQILGQVKAAFRNAENTGCIGRDLYRWVPRAFAAAKHVRAETGIFDLPVSVSSVAVEVASKIFEDLSGKKVVLLGAGKMSDLAALHLREAGASTIAVVNRTLSRAEEVAGKCSGLAVEFDRRRAHLAEADVIICSTNAPHYILDAEETRTILKGRQRRPLLLLDLSVPRNIDPQVSTLDGAYLFNLDDLEKVALANRKSRKAEADEAERVVQTILQKFLREENQASMAPVIADLCNQVRAICERELDRLEQRLPDLSKEQRAEMELLLHRIARKIVHPAIMGLKAIAGHEIPSPRRSIARPRFGPEGEAARC